MKNTKYQKRIIMPKKNTDIWRDEDVDIYDKQWPLKSQQSSCKNYIDIVTILGNLEWKLGLRIVVHAKKNDNTLGNWSRGTKMTWDDAERRERQKEQQMCWHPLKFIPIYPIYSTSKISFSALREAEETNLIQRRFDIKLSFPICQQLR